jgi:hypothetical protein
MGSLSLSYAFLAAAIVAVPATLQAQVQEGMPWTGIAGDDPRWVSELRRRHGDGETAERVGEAPGLALGHAASRGGRGNRNGNNNVGNDNGNGNQGNDQGNDGVGDNRGNGSIGQGSGASGTGNGNGNSGNGNGNGNGNGWWWR